MAKILFVGLSDAGSFAIRAKQLCEAHGDGWEYGSLQGAIKFRHDFDIYCFIKKADRNVIRLLRAGKKIIVYDILDSWRQPQDDVRCQNVNDALNLFAQRFMEYRFDGVIFPNYKMLNDFRNLEYVINPVHIYHHYWPIIKPIVVKEKPEILGYWGDPRFLGEWLPFLVQTAERHGLKFVVKPDYSQIDIGVAIRGAPYNNYLATNYKSPVKLVNFYAGGIPCILGEEASYKEIANKRVVFANDFNSFKTALARMLRYDVRLAAHEAFIIEKDKFSLSAIIKQYSQYFNMLMEKKSNGG